MADYAENLCTAMETIAQQAIADAGFDKTIQATVLRCEDSSSGQYLIKYQDSKFYAYSTRADVTYPANTLVYILVPNGDFSQNKTIIGSATKTASTYVTSIVDDSKYELIGGNIFIDDSYVYNMSSYVADRYYKLYDYTDTENSLLDLEWANTYIKNATYIKFGATIQTKLDAEQQYQGNYGLKLTLDFYDEDKNIFSRTYTIDVNNMRGNPYRLVSATEQYKFFQVDGENFCRINSVQAFVYNFPNTKIESSLTDEDFDINLTNFQLYAATALTEDELNSIGLVVTTPEGAIFATSAATDATKKIKAEIRNKGTAVDPYTETISFFWFIENATIKMTSDGYSTYGGQGWECVNEYTTLSNGSRNYRAGSYIYNIPISKMTTYEVRVKCVAIYNDEQYSKIVSVYNRALKDSALEITSSEGNIFYRNQGQTILTCTIGGVENNTDYKYVWIVTDSSDITTELESTTNTLTVDIPGIVSYSTYKAAVLTQSGNYVGTAYIVLTLSSEKPAETYRIVIQNKTQIFKYDENGISPFAIVGDTQTQEIKELSYKIYDTDGNELTDIPTNAKITWHIPYSDTLIKFSNGYKDTINEEYTSTTETITFEIKDEFDYTKTNNQIYVVFEYHDNTAEDETNFTFLKEGDNGSNGTGYYCRIIPNVNDINDLPDQTTLNITPSSTYLNYIPRDTSKWFRVLLYEGATCVLDSTGSSGDFTVKWEMLRNSYNNSQKDVIIFHFVNDNSKEYNNTGVVTIASKDLTTPPYATIVKCTVTYNDRQYIATYPVNVVYQASYDETIYQVKKSTGFKEVVYSSDGLTPKYDSRNPFEIEIIKSDSSDISLATGVTYSFAEIGTIYQKSAWESSGDLKKVNTTLNRNQYKIKPVSQYSGLCVTNGLYCTVTQNDDLLAYMWIPIHLMLNRYGLSTLNDWDGNSVSIDENGQYILSPQVGAGKKNSDNGFTGVLMGEIKNSQTGESQVGLFAYNDGAQTFKMDAETGGLVIGKELNGQIIINPGDSENSAVIMSGGYTKNASSGKGMRIDLSADNPEIRWGNGNFIVDKDGKLQATEAIISGNITATEGSTISGGTITGSTIQGGNIKIGGSNYDQFVVDRYGNCNIKRGSITIGNNFSVNSSGTLQASNAIISGNVTANSVSTGSTDCRFTVTSTGRVYVQNTVDNFAMYNCQLSLSEAPNATGYGQGKNAVIGLDGIGMGASHDTYLVFVNGILVGVTH